MPSPRLNEEEFLHMCYKRKGDLSNQQYTVYEDVNIQGEFKFGLMLGHGRFEKAFKVTHGAYIRSLDFQDAIKILYKIKTQKLFFSFAIFNFQSFILCTTNSKK